MQLRCTVKHQPDGRWIARHASADLGAVETSAGSRDEVVRKLRDELQYRIELCPCSGVSGDRVELLVAES